MRISIQLTLSLVFASLLGACTLLNGKKSESEPKLSKEEQKRLSEYKAEVTLGRDMAGRLLQYYGTYGEESLIGYVNQVGLYVASYSDHPDRRYMFSILDSESVNAFACPGGYILVTLGSIRNAKSEAELAMILGHEVAHVGKQHMFNTLKSMGDREMEKAAKDNEKKGKLSKSFESEVRKRPTADTSESAELLTRYLSQSAGAAMTLLQAAKAGMNVLLEQGLDKKLEYEADYEGTTYAIRAGYEPKALLRFLTRLQKAKKKKKVSAKILEKTHPKISDRKERIKKLLAKMDAKKITGASGKSRYKSYIEALPEKEN